MKKRIVWTLSLICAILAAAMGLRCGGSEVVGFGGSEVVGKLVDPKNEPVNGAKVYAQKINSSGGAAIVDSTGTFNGDYKFDKLDTGTYSLYGTYQNGELVVLIPNVHNDYIAPEGEQPHVVSVGTDTMLPPGLISGKVILYDDDNHGVMCYIPLTSFICVTDSAGNFKIPGLPPGTYGVYYSHGDYKAAKDTPVVVISGKDTLLPAKKLLLKKPATPRNLTSSYDIKTGTVTLRWTPVPFADLDGYVVRYKEKTAAQWDSAKAPDTIFLHKVYTDPTDTLPRDMQYAVKSCEKNSFNSSDFTKIIDVHTVPPSIGKLTLLYVSSPVVVAFNGTVRCSVVVAKYQNEYSIVMDFDGPGAAFGWTTVSHTGGIAASGVSDTSFLTNGACAWGSVAIRAASSFDTVDTAFSVDIRPRSDSSITAAAADSGVVLTWRQSPDSDFKRYSVHRKKTADTVIFTLDKRTDTTVRYVTYENGAADYWVTVTDTETVTSLPGLAARIAIINSPPEFTTKAADLPDSAAAGRPYAVTLKATDKNHDSLTYKALAPANATFSNGLFSWTPDTGGVGIHECKAEVSDAFGGKDTLTWNVKVFTHKAWLNGTQLKDLRRSFGIGVLNGKLYAAGGCVLIVDPINPNKFFPSPINGVEAYEPSSNAWTQKAPLSLARYNHCMVAWNGKLFVLGGTADSSGWTVYPTAIESYDTAQDKWTKYGSMPFVRFGAQACVIGDMLYCIGGEYPDPQKKYLTVFADTIKMYSFTTKAWSNGPTMKIPRSLHQAVAVNGKIYLFGGKVSPSQVTDSIEVYDPVAKTVSLRQERLKNARCSFAAGVIGNKVYLIGGTTLKEVRSDLEIVDVSGVTMQISAGEAMSQPRHGAGAAGLNGLIYCIGGSVGLLNSQSTKDVLLYYP